MRHQSSILLRDRESCDLPDQPEQHQGQLQPNLDHLHYWSSYTQKAITFLEG